MILGKKKLHEVLRPLGHLADQQVVAPLRGHVLLLSRGGTVELSATDGGSWLRTSLPCDGEFSACLAAKPLLDFLKPSGRVDGERVVELHPVANGQAVVIAGGVSITLASLPLEDYPKWPVDGAARMRRLRSWCAPDFRDALGWVLLAVGLDPTRRAITGVLFDKERVVATDGHRLHLARIGGLDAPALLPGVSMATLLHVLPKTGVLDLHRAGEWFVFRCGPWELATKPLDETFPPVDEVIPSKLLEQFHALVDGALLGAVLRRLPRSVLGPTSGVRLKINGAIEISSRFDDASGSTTVPVIESSHTGPDFSIGVNARYLRDAVNDRAEVALRFIGELDPVVVHRGRGRTAVVMPMRL